MTDGLAGTAAATDRHDPDKAARLWGRWHRAGEPVGIQPLGGGWVRYVFARGFVVEVMTHQPGAQDMTGSPFKAAANYEAFDAARRAAQVEQEERQRLREPETGIRCQSAPVPERERYGEPVEHWHAVSPVLGLPYEAFEFRQPGTLRTVTVKQFRVPVHGYD